MKYLFRKIVLLLLILFPFHSVISQEDNKITGNWLGVLKVSTIDLRIVFKITENEDGSLKAVLDSPDQGAYGIPVDSVIFSDPHVKLVVISVAGFFEGEYVQDSIAGAWNQGGASFPLTLNRSEEIKKPERPQEPKLPFPYIEEEVSYENKKAGLTLAGTLTYPENTGNLPAVILISGSGPQNRNEELLGHKPFLVLADHLTRNGFAVLRFDDRGVFGSTGDFSSATTEDFVTDVIAGIEYLKTRNEIDKNKIGLLGHSEGGLIAPLASVQSDDVNFIVMMAGPGMTGREILRLQTALIMKSNGAEEDAIRKDIEASVKMYDIIINEKDSATAVEKLREVYDKSLEEMPEEERNRMGDPEILFNQQLKVLLSPWFRFFLEYDPYKTLTNVDVPVLAINGEKDLQVPPKENLDLIEKALDEGGNKNFKVVELKGLNHLFQEAETGSPNEYSKIEQTISPDALNIITGWIKEVTR